LESGKKLARFTLATNENFKNAEGLKTEETTWHNIVAWNGSAEIASKYLTKGKEVCIDGRITYRTYTDKNGVQKGSTEIVVNELLLLGSAKEKPEKKTAREKQPAVE
ncbi:MAG TPA: single-stranded DNA-binding protein, partial [Bacteroidales bacterium]|nr:single-stranded DNA-binding protein [Bacteroidales bacterium]